MATNYSDWWQRRQQMDQQAQAAAQAQASPTPAQRAAQAYRQSVAAQYPGAVPMDPSAPIPQTFSYGSLTPDQVAAWQAASPSGRNLQQLVTPQQIAAWQVPGGISPQQQAQWSQQQQQQQQMVQHQQAAFQQLPPPQQQAYLQASQQGPGGGPPTGWGTTAAQTESANQSAYRKRLSDYATGGGLSPAGAGLYGGY